MKIVLAILLVAGVSFGATYLYVSNEKTAEFRKEKAEMEAKWSDEKERLERELSTAKNKSPRVEQVTETVEVVKTAQKTPEEILAILLQTKPASGNDRYQSIRSIIHQLESLRELGPKALPSIKAFLAKNEDISYERERETDANGQPQDGRGGRGGPPGGFRGFGNNGSNELPRTENYYPYSLRIGLFDVLKAIGGPEAETILVSTLQTTGRALEVAHLTGLLEEISPGKYAALAVSAAKDLLANPINIENPTRMDEQSKTYLYAILRKYNDTSFVPTAQTLLVSADGRIDRNALGYLTATLKEQSATMLYTLFNDARITNNFDKVSIAASAMNYVGMNAQADQMFKDIMGNEDAGPARFLAISRLDNGTLTPEVINSRIALLQSTKTQIQDERMQGMIDRTIQNLNNKLNPNAPQTDTGRQRGGFFGGFGGRRGGGN